MVSGDVPSFKLFVAFFLCNDAIGVTIKIYMTLIEAFSRAYSIKLARLVMISPKRPTFITSNFVEVRVLLNELFPYERLLSYVSAVNLNTPDIFNMVIQKVGIEDFSDVQLDELNFLFQTNHLPISQLCPSSPVANASLSMLNAPGISRKSLAEMPSTITKTQPSSGETSYGVSPHYDASSISSSSEVAYSPASFGGNLDSDEFRQLTPYTHASDQLDASFEVQTSSSSMSSLQTSKKVFHPKPEHQPSDRGYADALEPDDDDDDDEEGAESAAFRMRLKEPNADSSGGHSSSPEDSSLSPAGLPMGGNFVGRLPAESIGADRHVRDVNILEELCVPFTYDEVVDSSNEQFRAMRSNHDLTADQVTAILDARRRATNRQAAERCRQFRSAAKVNLSIQLEQLRSERTELSRRLTKARRRRQQARDALMSAREKIFDLLIGPNGTTLDPLQWRLQTTPQGELVVVQISTT